MNLSTYKRRKITGISAVYESTTCLRTLYPWFDSSRLSSPVGSHGDQYLGRLQSIMYYNITNIYYRVQRNAG